MFLRFIVFSLLKRNYFKLKQILLRTYLWIKTQFINIESKAFQAQCEFARSLLSPCFDLLKLWRRCWSPVNLVPRGEREDPGNEVGHQFEVLGWKNVAYQQQISKSCDSLQVSARIRSRETAYNWEDSQNKLNVPLPRTNYYKNSFTYSYSGIIHI